jgi:hypothetical protein
MHPRNMQRKIREWLMASALCVELGACASAPPPAPVEPVSPAPVASPTQAEAPAPSEPSVPAPTASSVAAPPPASTAESEPTPAAEISKPSRSPVDVLTSPDTAFLIDYAASAPIEAARRTCAEKSAAEPEAQAKCLSDARDAFKADVIRFRKDGSRWAWTVYKRSGSRLDEVTSGRVELSEISPNSVKVKFVSDKGMRPLLKNKREAVVMVPNDYSFEIDDAEWGKLQYGAKIGLVAN